MLSDNAAASVNEAHRLGEIIDRPKLMIQVPATNDGVEAIGELIAAGINVNVTLLPRWSGTRSGHAYLRGIARTPEPSQVAPVASLWSAGSTAVDRRLDTIPSRTARELEGTGHLASTHSTSRGPYHESIVRSYPTTVLSEIVNRIVLLDRIARVSPRSKGPWSLSTSRVVGVRSRQGTGHVYIGNVGWEGDGHDLDRLGT